MKKTFISSAYIYPVCPLNLNHAKMFIVGDIIARHARKNEREVFFPIASHYSGNTAHYFASIFTKFFFGKKLSEGEKNVVALYKDTYKVPTSILKNFTQPLQILNFFNREILWELKSLGVSGDYNHFYTTKHADFSIFINTIVKLYERHNFTVRNKKGELALNYDDSTRKKEMLDLLERTEFIQSFHKNNVLSASKNIRNDWGLLREDGFGVKYSGGWIIDPMFDSELFTVFDLYIRFKKKYRDKLAGSKKFFEKLFGVLSGKIKSDNKLIRAIAKWMPCDVFVCEEHLKNWIVKKLFAESLLLDKKYQTKKYFVLGMGLLNGKRMSASRGNAILARDLINNYGSIKARLIIILGGGHPSKTYKYDQTLSEQANKMLGAFSNYYTLLISLINGEIQSADFEKKVISQKQLIDVVEAAIQRGYYRQAVIALLSVFPEKYSIPTKKTASILILIYKRYLDILLPGLLETFKENEEISNETL